MEGIGAAEAIGASPPLMEAHGCLNKWYDDYLFEGLTARLAEMASDGS